MWGFTKGLNFSFTRWVKNPTKKDGFDWGAQVARTEEMPPVQAAIISESDYKKFEDIFNVLEKNKGDFNKCNFTEDERKYAVRMDAYIIGDKKSGRQCQYAYLSDEQRKMAAIKDAAGGNFQTTLQAEEAVGYKKLEDIFNVLEKNKGVLSKCNFTEDELQYAVKMDAYIIGDKKSGRQCQYAYLSDEQRKMAAIKDAAGDNFQTLLDAEKAVGYKSSSKP